MNALIRLLFLGVVVLPGAAFSQEDAESRLKVAEQTITMLTEENAKLREFALEALVGRRYDKLSTQDGKSYRDAVVTEASAEEVKISYTDGGKEQTATIKLDAGLPEWSVLLANGIDAGELTKNTPPKRTGKIVTPGEAVSKAIVVIEGDTGVGTGFMAEQGGKLYLYTAAHVLSGNTRLAVKLRNGKKITQFGSFEASDGADLVRIEVLESFENPLKIAANGSSKEGLKVFAAGNSGGGGTVGYEKGAIVGVGAESIEIDAQVIQGNSGGPILDAETHEVLGVVTHLIAARKDRWAKETRFSEVRRFGCRVDRTWGWDSLPIGRFLQEGQKLKEITDLNNLIVLALDPEQWDSSELNNYPNHHVVREIRELREWVKKRSRSSTGVSEADKRKKVASFFSGLLTSSKSQLRGFKPERYVWFHREMANEIMELRDEINDSCQEAVNEYR